MITRGSGSVLAWLFTRVGVLMVCKTITSQMWANTKLPDGEPLQGNFRTPPMAVILPSANQIVDGLS